MTSGVETEVMQNSSRIVKMMSAATLDGRRTGHLLVHFVWLLNKTEVL